MGLLILPEYLRKQPISPPLMNQSSVLGRQRWAMINIPGVTLSGSANPVATARSGAVYRYAKGGMSMVQTTNVAGGGFTFGTNAGLQLSTLSGVCVFSRDSAVSVSLFETSYQGISGGGFIIWCENGGKIEIDKHDITLLLQSTNNVLVNRPNAVAWSYNSSTGRTRIALNGVLTAGTATATFSHNTVSTLGYYSTTSAANTNPASLSLLAVSPDECFSDQALLEASVNPWSIFAPTSRRFWSPLISSTYTLSPGGSITFSGTATRSETKIQVPSGLVTFSGTASLTLTNGSTTYTMSPGGTITFSGTNNYNKERISYPTGSITFNGTAVELKTRSFIPTGNIVFSGNNTELRTKILAPTGLITFQGSAPITGPGGLAGATMTRLPMTGVGK